MSGGRAACSRTGSSSRIPVQVKSFHRFRSPVHPVALPFRGFPKIAACGDFPTLSTVLRSRSDCGKYTWGRNET